MPSSRNICTTCEFPMRTCYCHLVPQNIDSNEDLGIFNYFAIIIWQHPSEKKKTNNSIRYINDISKHFHKIPIKTITSRRFPENMDTLLYILYPSDTHNTSINSLRREIINLELSKDKNISSKNKQSINKINIIIIDATWTYSIQMFKSINREFKSINLSEIPQLISGVYNELRKPPTSIRRHYKSSQNISLESLISSAESVLVLLNYLLPDSHYCNLFCQTVYSIIEFQTNLKNEFMKRKMNIDGVNDSSLVNVKKTIEKQRINDK